MHEHASVLCCGDVCMDMLDVGLLQSGKKRSCSAGTRLAGLCSYSLQEIMHACTVL
jgi:hypothetical protein